jgi:hypothetical protein
MKTIQDKKFWLIYNLVFFLVTILANIYFYYRGDYILNWLIGGITMLTLLQFIDDAVKLNKLLKE